MGTIKQFNRRCVVWLSLKWGCRQRRVCGVLLLIGTLVLGGVALRHAVMSRMAASPPAPSLPLGREWAAFMFCLSQSECFLGLTTEELLEQKGKPFRYLLFVDGRRVAESGEAPPDASSRKGQKAFVWWYPTPTFFNTQGMHWIYIKNDTVVSELYVYEPIDASRKVERETARKLYLDIPWEHVLLALGAPRTIFVEVTEADWVTVRLRYEDTVGEVLELAGDMERVKYNEALPDDAAR